MKTRLLQVSGWLLVHRSQLQIVLFVALLSLVLVSLAVPGVIVLADPISPGPH